MRKISLFCCHTILTFFPPQMLYNNRNFNWNTHTTKKLGEPHQTNNSKLAQLYCFPKINILLFALKSTRVCVRTNHKMYGQMFWWKGWGKRGGGVGPNCNMYVYWAINMRPWLGAMLTCVCTLTHTFMCFGNFVAQSICWCVVGSVVVSVERIAFNLYSNLIKFNILFVLERFFRLGLHCKQK